MITDTTEDFEKIENEVNRIDKLSILNKLLSQTFDKRITELELNTSEHFAVISSGMNLTNLVCSLCTNISKRIKPKVEIPTTKRNFTPSRTSCGNKNNLSYLNKTRPKTPLKKIIFSMIIGYVIIYLVGFFQYFKATRIPFSFLSLENLAYRSIPLFIGDFIKLIISCIATYFLRPIFAKYFYIEKEI